MVKLKDKIAVSLIIKNITLNNYIFKIKMY